MTEPDPNTCAECGNRLAKGGRPSSDGKRWCMRKPCQQAKMRRYRQNLRDLDASLAVKVEKRPCSFCGDEMPERLGRITDTPVGRWCPKRGCQRDRATKQRLLRRHENGGLSDSDIVEITGMFWEMKRERGEQECPECHLSGLPGFCHPNMEGVSCKGLGGFLTPAREIAVLWPERIPPA